MAETRGTGSPDAHLHSAGAVMSTADVNAWFVREVLPLEPILMTYLRHHWPNKGDIEDLRQEIYARVHVAAQKRIPQPVKPFVFTVARNLLINRARQERVVPIEAVADLEALGIAIDAPAPDRTVIARDELRRLQDALDQLPPRCREAVILGRIEGLSGREIAARMNVGTATVSEHLENGMRLLANLLYGETPDSGKPK
jgi:RNA polymerase sigma factor (sigma-70 family)